MNRFTLPLSLTAVLLMAACDSKDAPMKPPNAGQARTVTVVAIERRSLASTAGASGLLVAREEAAAGVEQAGYRVVRVLVEEGARVRAGQPLAVLDPGVLRARLAQLQAQAENTQSEASRVRGLDGMGVVADEDIASRRNRARVAQEQLREAQTQLAQLTVRAPVSGTVLERTVSPGSVSSGEPMFRIARDGLIELDAEVPEAVLLDVQESSAAEVTLANGEKVNGIVRLIDPTIDSATRLGRVRVALSSRQLLRVGGYANATFEHSAEAVPVVPEKAVQYEASGPQVTVIDSRNRARRVAVRTGDRIDGFVELVRGPPVGTRVALGGGAFVLDGDLVTPVSASPPQPAKPGVAR